MSDETNSSPVSLAAGSYDADVLQKGLEKATKLDGAKRDAAINDALTKAEANGFKVPDARAAEGYEFKEVEHPELGVTETIQVAIPAKEEAEEKAPERKSSSTKGAPAAENGE